MRDMIPSLSLIAHFSFLECWCFWALLFCFHYLLDLCHILCPFHADDRFYAERTNILIRTEIDKSVFAHVLQPDHLQRCLHQWNYQEIQLLAQFSNNIVCSACYKFNNKGNTRTHTEIPYNIKKSIWCSYAGSIRMDQGGYFCHNSSIYSVCARIEARIASVSSNMDVSVHYRIVLYNDRENMGSAIPRIPHNLPLGHARIIWISMGSHHSQNYNSNHCNDSFFHWAFARWNQVTQCLIRSNHLKL